MPVQLPPPPVLNCSRLLEYAVLDESVGYAGRTFLFRGNKEQGWNEVGRVPCLAICEDKSGAADSVLLLLCGEQWSDVGCIGFATVAEARDWAEDKYPGVSSRWVQAHVTETEAERFLNELWGDSSCSFCGRRPDQGIERLIKKDNACICNGCVDEFYAEMRDDTDTTKK